LAESSGYYLNETVFGYQVDLTQYDHMNKVKVVRWELQEFFKG